ncbi:7869_t:CDS:2, partial [Ambispora leptoticha]
CDFDNIEKLFDTDSNDFGFEKVDNTVESFESLRYHDTTDEEYVAISKESWKKDSSQESINESCSSVKTGFNEEDINKKIERYITINGETPRNVFIWLLNNKSNSKQICLLGRFYHGRIGTNKNSERAFNAFFNVKENAGKKEL